MVVVVVIVCVILVVVVVVVVVVFCTRIFTVTCPLGSDLTSEQFSSYLSISSELFLP